MLILDEGTHVDLVATHADGLIDAQVTAVGEPAKGAEVECIFVRRREGSIDDMNIIPFIARACGATATRPIRRARRSIDIAVTSEFLPAPFGRMTSVRHI